MIDLLSGEDRPVSQVQEAFLLISRPKSPTGKDKVQCASSRKCLVCSSSSKSLHQRQRGQGAMAVLLVLDQLVLADFVAYRCVKGRQAVACRLGTCLCK